MKPIDIFIASYLRLEYTRNTIKYLKERTTYPYRLFLLDNGGNESLKNEVDYYVRFSKNMGIHALWNVASSLAESEYFITTDNDILVPKLEPDWLERVVDLMDMHRSYGAISLHPHIFIGINGEDPLDIRDVVEAPMAGAVMRIMRRGAVWQAGGWERIIEAGRNHEERTISSRLQAIGYKVGRTTRIRAWHEFGENWGYPEEFTPEMQKHNPDLKDYVNQFNNKDAYDPDTWLPRK